MSKLKIYNQKGEVKKEIAVPKIFDIKLDKDLVSRYIQFLLQKKRESIANTKNRGQVSGGGRKPWKQKGTGNARAGSSRSPIWRGGGVTFGPTNEKTYTIRMNSKERQKAIVMVLAEKIKSAVVVESIKINEFKTKKAVEILNNLPINAGKVIFLQDELDEKVIYSFQNLPFVTLAKADNLNLLEIMKSEQILLNESALNQIVSTYQNVK